MNVNGFDRLLFFLLPTVFISLRNSVRFVCTHCLNLTIHEVEGQHLKRREKKLSGKQAVVNVFRNRGLRSLALFLTVGTSTTGLMSTSPSNGQPQSWQAVNQGDYRKPLVLGYTIKSGNGLIKPATPQQTFWFCLLRAARSLRWMKIRQPFFFCALLPGVSCSWSMSTVRRTALRAIYLHCTPTAWILEENLWLRGASIELHVTDALLIYSELVINARCAQSAGLSIKDNSLH